jgi:hypothetical protein
LAPTQPVSCMARSLRGRGVVAQRSARITWIGASTFDKVLASPFAPRPAPPSLSPRKRVLVGVGRNAGAAQVPPGSLGSAVLRVSPFPPRTPPKSPFQEKEHSRPWLCTVFSRGGVKGETSRGPFAVATWAAPALRPTPPRTQWVLLALEVLLEFRGGGALSLPAKSVPPRSELQTLTRSRAFCRSDRKRIARRGELVKRVLASPFRRSNYPGGRKGLPWWGPRP